jgi:hypothetical protein
MTKRKWLHVIVLLFLVVTLAGCNPKQNQNATGQEQTEGGVITQDSSKPEVTGETQKAVTDKEVTEELSKESGVSSANVYEQNDMVLGAIVLKSAEDAVYAQGIANKYLDMIKAKYPGKRVVIQVVSNNKNLAYVEHNP